MGRFQPVVTVRQDFAAGRDEGAAAGGVSRERKTTSVTTLTAAMINIPNGKRRMSALFMIS